MDNHIYRVAMLVAVPNYGGRYQNCARDYLPSDFGDNGEFILLDWDEKLQQVVDADADVDATPEPGA